MRFVLNRNFHRVSKKPLQTFSIKSYYESPSTCSSKLVNGIDLVHTTRYVMYGLYIVKCLGVG